MSCRGLDVAATLKISRSIDMGPPNYRVSHASTNAFMAARRL